MNRLPVMACAALLGLSCVAGASDNQKPIAAAQSSIGHIQRLNPAINAIVPADAVIEVLAEGHGWTEGPLWVPQLNALLYSDIPANAIYIYDDAVGARPWIEPSPGYPRRVRRVKRPGPRPRGAGLSWPSMVIDASPGSRAIGNNRHRSSRRWLRHSRAGDLTPQMI